MSVSDNSSGRGSIVDSPPPGDDDENSIRSGESLHESELSLNDSPTNSVSEPVNPLETELQLQDLPVLMTTETLNQLPGPTLNFPSNYLEHFKAIGHPTSESNESVRSMVSNLRSFLQRNPNLGSSDSKFCRRELKYCSRLVSTLNYPSSHYNFSPLARPITSIPTRNASSLEMLRHELVPHVRQIDDNAFKTDSIHALRARRDRLLMMIDEYVFDTEGISAARTQEKRWKITHDGRRSEALGAQDRPPMMNDENVFDTEEISAVRTQEKRWKITHDGRRSEALGAQDRPPMKIDENVHDVKSMTRSTDKDDIDEIVFDTEGISAAEELKR